MTPEFEGRQFVVTGGAGGTGSICARQLLERGAYVLLVDPDATRLNAVQARLQGGDRLAVNVSALASPKDAAAALDAAAGLDQAGISVEVIDPRTVSPIDWETIFASVDKTGRALIVNEATLVCSVASEIAATIGEKRFNSLDGPVRRIGSPFVPKPSTPGLEKLAYPSIDEIFSTASDMMPRKRVAA